MQPPCAWVVVGGKERETPHKVERDRLRRTEFGIRRKKCRIIATSERREGGREGGGLGAHRR